MLLSQERGRGESGCVLPAWRCSRLCSPGWPTADPACHSTRGPCEIERSRGLVWTAKRQGRMLSMMAISVELERVRRRSGGRIHLTPHVPETGTVVSLCNQSFAEGTYQKTEAEADCRNCLRRRDDPARVSTAFFQSDVGSELLQRSLEQALARRAGRHTELSPATGVPAKPASRGGKPGTAPPAPGPPVAGQPEAPPAAGPGPAPPPSRPAPVIRELRSRIPLRKTFENVFTSPQGVIVRVSRDGSVDHVTFDGPVDIRRRAGVITVRVGDVVLDLEQR